MLGEHYPSIAEMLNALSNELCTAAEQLAHDCEGTTRPAAKKPQPAPIDTSARLVASLVSMQAPSDEYELIRSLHQAAIALLEARRLIASASEQLQSSDLPTGSAGLAEQARLIVRGSQALQHGIGLLTGERRLGALQSVCDTIGQIEIAADINKRQAVARLLRSNAPGPERQTLRALYETLEDITDRYEDAIDALLDVASLGDPGTAGNSNS
jgi:hypothetical protein